MLVWCLGAECNSSLLRFLCNIWLTLQKRWYLDVQTHKRSIFQQTLAPVCMFCQNWERMPPETPTSDDAAVSSHLYSFGTEKGFRMKILASIPCANVGVRPKTNFSKPSSGNIELLIWSGFIQNLAWRQKPWRYGMFYIKVGVRGRKKGNIQVVLKVDFGLVNLWAGFDDSGLWVVRL